MAAQPQVQQRRISAATVDYSPEDLGDETTDETKSLDTKSVKKFREPKAAILTPEPPEDEHESDSGSTGSDIRDVLNCIRDPRDIKHSCHISCQRLKKEECKVYKAAPYLPEEEHENYPYGDISYGDYDLLGAKPVRIPIVHVKDCVHERESGDDLKRESPAETGKWCFCEDQGTSDEEPCYDYHPVEEFRDINDAGFVKVLPPKLVQVDESGAADWKNIQQDSDLQDVLNCMLPPKVYTMNGQVWMQEVSPEPARRTDVIKLVEALEMKIVEQQVKNKGLDSVRRSLYAQLFDEMIREETVVSPETGLLLLRIRDELMMTCDAWESILSQAHNYGVQNISTCGMHMKPLQAEVEKLLRELITAEDELAEFWAEQYLIKSEEQKKRENVLEDRKAELAPHQSRNKLYKEQIRLLVNRDEDGVMQQSHLS